MKSVEFDTTTWLCGPPSKNGRKQQYPSRFEYNLHRYYPEVFDKNTLHMFSGTRNWGITTDIDKQTDCDYVCDYQNIPLASNSISYIIADPPYANHYQNEWYGDLPKPKLILKEASRLVKPGGLILILHIIIIPAYKEFNVKRIALHPILTGPNNAIRVLNVFRKL